MGSTQSFKANSLIWFVLWTTNCEKNPFQSIVQQTKSKIMDLELLVF